MALLGLFTSGCAVSRMTVPPQPSACVADRQLVGRWSDARMTGLGPAWIRFSFGPDCTFSARVQLLYARISETGRYETSEGRLTYHRASGTTRWVYRIAGDRLTLEEGPGEQHSYARTVDDRMGK